MKLKQYKPPTQSDMASWQSQMREAFFEGVTQDDMRAIAARLVEDAKKGDQGAIKLLLAYGIGSPQVNVRNAVIVSQGDHGARTPLPCAPTAALPATEGKIEAMARRAANGQAIFHDDDRKLGIG